MSFARLLPLLLLVPALTLADSDKNFKIAPHLFKVGMVVDQVADMAIRGDKGVGVSEQMSFPIGENRICFRHKRGPKEYQWMTGNIVVKNLKKLHAFNLAENYLNLEDVATMRFYGSQNAKAFQDEADLYFDNEYIYSARVPKLFFVRNGQWQMLKETALPGAIEISSQVKDFEVDLNNVKYKAPKMIFPVKAGLQSLILSAPGYLPYVEVGVLLEGDALQIKPSFLKIENTPDTTKKLSVTLDEIASTQGLDNTEKLYDKYVAELRHLIETVDKTAFEKAYPRQQEASFFTVSNKKKSYAEYDSRYKATKDAALRLWRESKVAGVDGLNKAFRAKFDSLEALPLRGAMMPASLEPVFEEVPADESIDSAKAALAVKSDSAAAPVKPVMRKRIARLKMNFGVDHSRFDFSWEGYVDGVEGDSIYTWIVKRNPELKVYLDLENNKPVWIQMNDTTVWRHHYRYVNLEFHVGQNVHKGIGSFVLPQYLLDQPEVQEWLKSRPVPSEKPVVAEKKQDSISLSILDNIATAARIIRDKDRGSLALIDSGKFRFRGHVVRMSPFAIMTTEMTQVHFQKTMMKLDSAKRIQDRSTFKNANKPVHNITWDDARATCKVLGGDLPSEAQWEFAALADNVDGAIWVKDSVSDPGAYAVYRGNSYNLGKRFDAYGPQPVGSKKPNAWGLHDMSGNVAEWTRDKYFMFSFMVEESNPTGAMIGSSKVYKGGSWKDGEKNLNVTRTDDEDPRYWSETIGFRCVFPRDSIKE